MAEKGPLTLRDAVDVEPIQRVLHRQDLDRAAGGQEVRVVLRVRAERSC